MQTDMHYYATYALARAAGISAPAAIQVATCAQFVDDSRDLDCSLADRTLLDFRATAHGTSLAIEALDDTVQNTDQANQRYVWLPFHFLPGGEGESEGERFLCRKDSPLARQMLDHHLKLAREDYGLALVGVMAHVYADTFSHYGFSGVSDELNLVDTRSIHLEVESKNILDYVLDKARSFLDELEKRAGKSAEDLTRLGHGGVATFPDRPYLSWRFRYEDGRESGQRFNQVTYLEYCARIHEVFVRLRQACPELDAHDVRAFASIEAAVRELLAIEGDMEARIAAWKRYARQGRLFGCSIGEAIPSYDPSSYLIDAAGLSRLSREKLAQSVPYRFMKAASIHRQYVLEELLPEYAIFPIMTM